jgi:putative SOS response-associated peptidase YedK
MCGRYVLKRKDLEALLTQLGIKDPRDFVSRFNIAPTTVVPAIRVKHETSAREAVGLQWGLVPFWAKDAKSGARLANARAEGIATKPSFREPFRRRRCVVPASGFYEWQTLGQKKYPWFFQLRDESPFVFAGLWEHWRGADRVVLETCSLITTTPNEVVSPLHDRMPVILRDTAIDTWLDPSIAVPARLEPLLVPLPGALMKSTPVSPRMNHVRHEGPDCIEPVPPPVPPTAEPADLQLPLEPG